MTTIQPQQMRFESLFLDFDGTLVDSLPGIAFSIEQAFKICGRSMPQVNLRTMIGPSVRTILGRLSGDVAASEVDRLESAFRVSYDTEGWTRTSTFPRVTETLQALSDAGVRLFIFTNKPSAVTMRIVRQLKIEPLFQEIVSKDSITPLYTLKAQMVRALIKHHGVDEKRSAVVGDSTEDFDAARANNQPFFFAGYGYGELADTSLLEHVAVISNFSDLVIHCTGAV